MFKSSNLFRCIDKNENFCYNIIKEVAERKLFNLIKNKQNCCSLSQGREDRAEGKLEIPVQQPVRKIMVAPLI